MLAVNVTATAHAFNEVMPQPEEPSSPVEGSELMLMQMTPTAGRVRLQALRPQVSAALDLARARGRAPSGPGVPSRFPGEPPLYVGSGAHATDFKVLKRLEIKAVVNCAPSVCKTPKDKYKQNGIAFLEIDARDDRSFPLLKECLSGCSQFITAQHAAGNAVLVHCMAGVNRSATLAVGHLLLKQKRNLFELFAECVAARPAILQNPSFQLQLCALAQRNGLLYEPDEAAVTRGLLYQPPSPPGSNEKTIEWPRASDEAVAAQVAAAEAAAAETEAVQQAPSSPVASRPHKSPSNSPTKLERVEYESMQDSARPDAVSLL